MTTSKKTKLNLFVMLVLAIAFSSCVTQDYDLTNGVNTDMSLGGDSLSVTIGKTNKILLGSLVDSLSLDILKKSTGGGYALQLKDSTGVSINALNPVSFSIAPISISPINTNLATINIPAINISPVNLSSNLSFFTIDITKVAVPSMDASYPKVFDLSKVAHVRRLTKPSGVSKSQLSTPLVTFHDTIQSTINQALSYSFPSDEPLQKINTISLKNKTVTLTFNKTGINNLTGFDSKNDTITYFKIDFPSEYTISNAIGVGTSISGNSFIIENAELSPTNTPLGVYTATFQIDKIDYRTLPQLNSLIYNKDITCKMIYSFAGSPRIDLDYNQKANVTVQLKSAPAIDDMSIQTNDFLVSVPSGSNPITQVVTLPTEIAKVNTLTFEDGATLQLNIADPIINPFGFNAGNCVIQLPQKMIFKPYSGLNTSTNLLTIPYSQLFGIKTIGISGMNINQTVSAGNTITINDNLSYNIQGLNVASLATSVSVINGMSGKTINVIGTVSPLTIKNSSIVTNSITMNIPDQNTNIDINQFVSNDVKKIYTLSLLNTSDLVFKIQIANLPSGIDSVFFKNYTIQLPTFLKFKTDAELNAQNQLILNRGFKVTTGFSKTLTIQNIDFGTSGIDLVNGTFILHQAVTMKGSAYIKGSNLNSSDISNVTITPTVTIGSMSIAQIVGQISPTIQPVSQNVTLNLPGFLTNGASVLDIVNPVLSLEIGNSMGIPMDLDLTLTPKRNGSPIIAGTINTKISIKPAAILGQTTWSRYWISNWCKGYSAGFDTVNVALQNLLRSIPDQIEIKANPTVTGTKQSVDLNSPKNELNLKYSVNVPLNFGKDFVINYTDTIADLQKSLADILKLSHEISIIAIVENSIPLELSFSANPLNASKALISGVTISSIGTIKSGNYDFNTQTSSAQTSRITIGLKETTTGSLNQLDKLAIKVSAKSNSTVAGAPLKTDQYVRLELKVLLPKGINITTNK